MSHQSVLILAIFVSTLGLVFSISNKNKLAINLNIMCLVLNLIRLILANK